MTDAARTTYARACASYDAAFEHHLVDVIITAIGTASMASDANVMMLRTGEMASALLTVLAGVLAMSPAATRSPTAIRRTIDELDKRLRRRVAQAESDPAVQEFLRRCFDGSDVGGHG